MNQTNLFYWHRFCVKQPEVGKNRYLCAANFGHNFFLQNLKILNSENFTFSFVTFDTVELYECTIPKNNGMNQGNLLCYYRFCVKQPEIGKK